MENDSDLIPNLDRYCTNTVAVVASESGSDDLIVIHRQPHPPESFHRWLVENKTALVAALAMPATAAELEAVKATGRNPSPLLSRGEARLLATVPLPRWPTPSLGEQVDAILTGKLPKTRERPPQWHHSNASAKQVALLEKFGVTAPPALTKGRASAAIDLLMKAR